MYVSEIMILLVLLLTDIRHNSCKINSFGRYYKCEIIDGICGTYTTEWLFCKLQMKEIMVIIHQRQVCNAQKIIIIVV